MLISQDERRFIGKIAFLAMWSGMQKEGEEIFSTLEKHTPPSIGLYIGLAQAHMHKGDFDGAKVYIDKAQELDPNDEHAKLWQGMYLLASGEKTEAKKLLMELQSVAKGEDVLNSIEALLKE